MKWYHLLISLGLASCAGGQAFTPPPVYREWWAKDRECSGLNGNMPLFVSMPGETFGIAGQQVWGYWSRSSNTVYLASHHLLDEQVVRHEMLHSLIGHPGHPKDLFITKCNVCQWQRCGDG